MGNDQSSSSSNAQSYIPFWSRNVIPNEDVTKKVKDYNDLFDGLSVVTSLSVQPVPRTQKQVFEQTAIQVQKAREIADRLFITTIVAEEKHRKDGNITQSVFETNVLKAFTTFEERYKKLDATLMEATNLWTSTWAGTESLFQVDKSEAMLTFSSQKDFAVKRWIDARFRSNDASRLASRLLEAGQRLIVAYGPPGVGKHYFAGHLGVQLQKIMAKRALFEFMNIPSYRQTPTLWRTKFRTCRISGAHLDKLAANPQQLEKFLNNVTETCRVVAQTFSQQNNFFKDEQAFLRDSSVLIVFENMKMFLDPSSATRSGGGCGCGNSDSDDSGDDEKIETKKKKKKRGGSDENRETRRGGFNENREGALVSFLDSHRSTSSAHLYILMCMDNIKNRSPKLKNLIKENNADLFFDLPNKQMRKQIIAATLSALYKPTQNQLANRLVIENWASLGLQYIKELPATLFRSPVALASSASLPDAAAELEKIEKEEDEIDVNSLQDVLTTLVPAFFDDVIGKLKSAVKYVFGLKTAEPPTSDGEERYMDNLPEKDATYHLRIELLDKVEQHELKQGNNVPGLANLYSSIVQDTNRLKYLSDSKHEDKARANWKKQKVWEGLKVLITGLYDFLKGQELISRKLIDDTSRAKLIKDNEPLLQLYKELFSQIRPVAAAALAASRSGGSGELLVARESSARFHIPHAQLEIILRNLLDSKPGDGIAWRESFHNIKLAIEQVHARDQLKEPFSPIGVDFVGAFRFKNRGSEVPTEPGYLAALTEAGRLALQYLDDKTFHYLRPRFDASVMVSRYYFKGIPKDVELKDLNPQDMNPAIYYRLDKDSAYAFSPEFAGSGYELNQLIEILADWTGMSPMTFCDLERHGLDRNFFYTKLLQESEHHMKGAKDGSFGASCEELCKIVRDLFTPGKHIAKFKVGEFMKAKSNDDSFETFKKEQNKKTTAHVTVSNLLNHPYDFQRFVFQYFSDKQNASLMMHPNYPSYIKEYAPQSYVSRRTEKQMVDSHLCLVPRSNSILDQTTRGGSLESLVQEKTIVQPRPIRV